MNPRELDSSIAEKVFGAKVTFLDQKHGWRIDYIADKEECNDPIITDMGYDGYRLKRYSEDIRAAFEIVEKLRNPKQVFSLATLVHRSKNPKMEWIAKWEFFNPNYDFVFSFNESVAMAICEASLKLVERNV